MREIKFRKFQDGKIIYLDALVLYKDKEDLMQYTGLKDQEDNEVYEGDIVNTIDGIGKIEFLEFGWIVAFKDKFYHPLINYLTYDSNDELVFIYDIFNVIGNIYENKELLED